MAFGRILLFLVHFILIINTIHGLDIVELTLDGDRTCFQDADAADLSHCYIISDFTASWQTAQGLCADLGGQLVEVKDADTEAVIEWTLASSESLSGAAITGAWIGLQRVSKPWTWVGAPQQDFNDEVAYWDQEPSAGNSTINDCAHIVTPEDYVWQDVPCANPAAVICQAEKGTAPCLNEVLGFDEALFSLSSRCLLVHYDLRNFADAEAFCEERGATLLRIDGEEVQNLLRDQRIGFEQRVSKFWLGLERAEWHWFNTGVQARETYWRGDQPNRLGNCVSLEQVFGNIYKWSNWNCDRELHGLCQIPSPSPATTTTTPTISSSTTTSATITPTPSTTPTVTSTLHVTSPTLSLTSPNTLDTTSSTATTPSTTTTSSISDSSQVSTTEWNVVAGNVSVGAAKKDGSKSPVVLGISIGFSILGIILAIIAVIVACIYCGAKPRNKKSEKSVATQAEDVEKGAGGGGGGGGSHSNQFAYHHLTTYDKWVAKTKHMRGLRSHRRPPSVVSFIPTLPDNKEANKLGKGSITTPWGSSTRVKSGIDGKARAPLPPGLMTTENFPGKLQGGAWMIPRSQKSLSSSENSLPRLSRTSSVTSISSKTSSRVRQHDHLLARNEFIRDYRNRKSMTGSQQSLSSSRTPSVSFGPPEVAGVHRTSSKRNSMGSEGLRSILTNSRSSMRSTRSAKSVSVSSINITDDVDTYSTPYIIS